MPNASDPYGSFAYQERIIRENKFFLATLDRNRMTGLGGTSPRTHYTLSGSPTKVRLNTLSGELEYPRVHTPRINSPRVQDESQKQALEHRVEELEAELENERKGRQAIQSQLKKLEEIIEQRSSEKKENVSKVKEEKDLKYTTLPPVPPTALRSPRRMPHNLY